MKNIKQAVQCICCMVIFMLLTNLHSNSQDTQKIYTIKNGKMYIWLSKKLPVAELDNFIKQYDLQELALKRFINTGNDDSIQLAGWSIGLNNTSTFTLIKPLLSADINNPGGRITFNGENPTGENGFPMVSNAATYGCNNFRNKQSFTIKDSIVTFFLRNNTKASRVMLAGSFNNWDPGILPMKRTDSGWIAAVKLIPGKYWYKFIVDGNWIVDSDNKLNENDGQGNTNSVFYYTNTTFRLKGYSNAKKVIVAGSFNNWHEKELVMNKTPDGWELPVYLPEGTHTYRFIADRNWMTDPGNPLRFPNEHNDFNSVITIGKAYIFKLDGYTNARKVILAGSFNAWKDNELLMMKTATGWQLPYVIGPGNYEYKFIVDGKAVAPPGPTNAAGKGSSYLVLEPNYTFRLKGYDGAKAVFLAGDFNNWTPDLLQMKKENGEWVFRVHLSPGKHLYKFIADGNWILDPGNKLWEENDQNTGNSVLWIRE